MQSGNDIDARQPRVERRPRTLLDELLAAFHFACDVKDYDVARRLLATAENTIALKESAGTERRRGLSAIVAAHERLWSLAHGGDWRSDTTPAGVARDRYPGQG
jgi:hypothetical protein